MTEQDDEIAPDLIERLRARFSGHAALQRLAFELEDLSMDRCVMSLRFSADIDSGAGNIHGGILASLADTAIACALSTSFDGKMGFATSNLNIHYLRRARSNVTASAVIIKKGSKVCVGQADIRDVDQKLVATVTADFVLTTSRLSPREAEQD
ncbi:MAG TPA: PaaI family thioesterase [Thermoanaerobaculia bacterium]|nr:PaaI family thioesterase [Thermoanaerobaculia bacterium]